MITLIIEYYVLAVVTIWLGQLILNTMITIRGKLWERRVSKTSEDRFAPLTDALIRGNGLIRITMKVAVLLLLGFGAWLFSQSAGGWWWVLWLMFVYNLFGGITTLPLDLVFIMHPDEVRNNPEAFQDMRNS